VQITGKSGNFLKHEYSSAEIISKLNEIELEGHETCIHLDCYDTQNTLEITSRKPGDIWPGPSFKIRNYTSDDLGRIAEHVDCYLAYVRICLGPTSSKKCMAVFDNRSIKTD